MDTSNDPLNCGTPGNVCDKNTNHSGVGYCENGVCKYKCYADRCGEKCTVLGTDKENCGVCGHICPVGEFCEDGRCLSNLDAVLTEWVPNPQPKALAVDESFIYWTGDYTYRSDAGTLMKVSKAGGAAVRAISGVTYQPDAHGFAVDETHLYWTALNTTGILRALKADGAATEKAVEAAKPYEVRLDSTHVYWREKDGSLHRAAKGGSSDPGSTIPTTAPANSYLLDDAEVYYASGKSVLRVAKDGTGSALVFTAPEVASLWLAALDANNVVLGWETSDLLPSLSEEVAERRGLLSTDIPPLPIEEALVRRAPLSIDVMPSRIDKEGVQTGVLSIDVPPSPTEKRIVRRGLLVITKTGEILTRIQDDVSQADEVVLDGENVYYTYYRDKYSRGIRTVRTCSMTPTAFGPAADLMIGHRGFLYHYAEGNHFTIERLRMLAQ